MFQFAFEAADLSGQEHATIWATIFDQDGKVVYRAATRDGERHTAQAVLFSPGSYTVEIQTGTRYGGNPKSRQGIEYRLLGIHVGEGQGPEFVDPTTAPFDQNDSGQYQYPDDVLSAAVFLFVDGLSSNQPHPPSHNPPPDLHSWYWGSGI